VDTRSDAEVSRDVARLAGALLLELRSAFIAENGPIDSKEVANALRDKADAASHEFIMEHLGAARPQDSILSEEGKDNADRLDADRVWIVDPLDGTWEYGQDRVDFAVHIALWEPASQSLSACTVDLPAQGLTRSVLDTEGLAPVPDRPLRIVASRSRPPAALAGAVEILRTQFPQGVEILDVGSVGAKVNEILSGRADAYVHDTGFYEWDVAAPYGVAQHYGLVASHLDGSHITFNYMPPYVSDLIVARRDIANAVRSALVEASAS